MLEYLKLLRINPHNIALFAFGSSIAYAVTGSIRLINALFGIIIFTLTYSSAYIINDLHDLEYDRNHRVARKRRAPLITGKVSIKNARRIALMLLFGGIAASLFINPLFSSCLIWLLVLNIAYTNIVKQRINLIPYWHALITYVKLLGGYVLVTNSTAQTPWILLLIPGVIYAYYSLEYRKPLIKNHYGLHKALIIAFLLISLSLTMIVHSEFGIKTLLSTIIALIVSALIYHYNKQKDLNASYMKSQYIGAALLWVLNAIMVS